MQTTIKDCGKGVNKDLLPSELLPGQWSDALNMRFKNEFAEKRGGITAFYTTPTAAPYWLNSYATTAGRYLVQAGLASVFVDDGTVRTDITGTAPTGAIGDRWTGGVLNGVLVMNNGKDDLQFWNGDTGTNLATVTGWTAGWKSDSVRPFKNFLVCLGNTRGGAKQPHNVAWSTEAEPGAIPTSFTASSTNMAGDVDLAESTGQMVDSLPWGDVNIIYKQDARYAMSYIGGNDVFRFQRLPGSDGLLARGCAVNTPKGQVFLSNGDVRIHTGGESQSIAEGRIRKWLFNNMDGTNAARSFLVLNPQKTEVWVCFPSFWRTACDTVAAWNWESNTWGIFSVPNLTAGVSAQISGTISAETWASDPDIWSSDSTAWVANEYSESEQRLIVCNTATIGLADTGVKDFGESVSWLLEKRGIHFDDPESIKVPKGSRWHFSGTDGTAVSIQHGTAMTAAGVPTYSVASTHTQGTSNWINQFATGGRYIAVKAAGSADQPLSLRSFDLDYKTGGRF